MKTNFQGLGLDPKLMHAIQDLGFERPTPVQISPPAMHDLAGRELTAPP